MSILPALFFLDGVIAYVVVTMARDYERKENIKADIETEEYLDWIKEMKEMEDDDLAGTCAIR